MFLLENSGVYIIAVNLPELLLENVSSNVTPITYQMQLNRKATGTARNEVHICTKYESGVLIPET